MRDRAPADKGGLQADSVESKEVMMSYIAGNMCWALVLAGGHVDGHYLVLCANLLQADQNASHVRRRCWPVHLHCHFLCMWSSRVIMG